MSNNSFFKTILGGLNTARLIIINILFFVALFIIFGLFSANNNNTEETVHLESGSVLVIDPSGVLTETKSELQILEKLFDEEYQAILVSDIIKAIKNAAYDRRIDSLFFDFSGLYGLSYANLEDISEAIDEFKKSGKPYYAFSTYYGVPEYYLARKADRIGLDPFGGIDLIAFASEFTFFKDMEEKFGIEWNVIHAGEYKGAAEKYGRKNMSNQVRQNYESVFNDFWQFFISKCSEDRNIPKENFSSFANNQYEILQQNDGSTVKAALNLKLITDSITIKQFITDLDMNYLLGSGSKPCIDYKHFNKTIKTNSSTNKICIINIDGGITSNSKASDENAISWEIVEQFETAINDNNIKAIVLRINSGGGEVFASETIRRAVETAKLTKPVVVSMGSMAASGAYWISSSANYIFANPYSITGSIGVLTMNPSLKNTISKYLGINSELIYAGQKPFYSVTQNKTPEELAIMQLKIQNIYNQFLNIVSKGRSIPIEQLEKYAGGRIYSAKQALKINLIDEIGTLNSCIKYTAKIANIANNYSITRIKTKNSMINNIMDKMLESKTQISNLPYLKTYLEIMNMNQTHNFYVYSPLKFESYKQKNQSR